MVDIAPESKTGFNEGISCDLEGFEVLSNYHGGGRLIPQHNQRIEPTKQAGALQEDMWSLPVSLMMTLNKELQVQLQKVIPQRWKRN